MSLSDVVVTGICAYCGGPFIPREPGQKFCKPNHKTKAKHKQRRGIIPVRMLPPPRNCPWCGTLFETLIDSQACCCAEHNAAWKTCQRKEDYLSEDAAAAAAARISVPGLRGQLGYYRCRSKTAPPHWHLYNEDKQQAKRAQWLMKVAKGRE